MQARLFFAIALCCCAQPASSAEGQVRMSWSTLDGKPPLVIAHRGASGYRPEHTLASYSLAIEQGADFVEPDLVSTKDGHLICRHEPLLDATTDVLQHPEFASRKAERVLDGKPTPGFYASDFTLAEIKTLRAVQPNPARSRQYDRQFEIPTFEEILDLVERESRRRGRTIGVYPETKHPAFHLALGLPLEDRLLEILRRRKLDRADAPVFIQSFESANLQYLRTKTKIPLVQLFDDDYVEFDASGAQVIGIRIAQYGDARGDAAPRSLRDIKKYADAIGPWKRHILRDVGAPMLLRSNLIDQAHAAQLRVHTYTFRSEPQTLAAEYTNDPAAEYRAFYALGIDGVFSDFPDIALAARSK